MVGHVCRESVQHFTGRVLSGGKGFLHSLLADFVDEEVFSLDKLNSLLESTKGLDKGLATYELLFQNVS